MPIALTWPEIAIRLLCTVAAGALIGTNRSEHGRAAGLRTSILVGLAACIAMLQVNLLLPLAGRSSDSFVMNDLMRLPLGILSGMGRVNSELRCELHWRAKPYTTDIAEAIRLLTAREGVVRIAWTPQAR